MMVRSFDRRLESLFLLTDDLLKKQVKNILQYNLKDNVNAYVMQEDGTYVKKDSNGEDPFNIHKEFYKVNKENLLELDLSFKHIEESITDEVEESTQAN